MELDDIKKDLRGVKIINKNIDNHIEFIFAIEDNLKSIVSYVAFLPITKDDYFSMLQGNLDTKDEINTFRGKDETYFLMITHYNNQDAETAVVTNRTIKEVLINMSTKQNINIQGIITESDNLKYEIYLKRLGFTLFTKNIYNANIFDIIFS